MKLWFAFVALTLIACGSSPPAPPPATPPASTPKTGARPDCDALVDAMTRFDLVGAEKAGNRSLQQILADAHTSLAQVDHDLGAIVTSDTRLAPLVTDYRAFVHDTDANGAKLGDRLSKLDAAANDTKGTPVAFEAAKNDLVELCKGVKCPDPAAPLPERLDPSYPAKMRELAASYRKAPVRDKARLEKDVALLEEWATTVESIQALKNAMTEAEPDFRALAQRERALHARSREICGRAPDISKNR